MEKRLLPTALYCRLSREDGDRMESDSIGNQRKLLEAYIENHPELVMAECYADDGYTGTNFQRPAFQRMLRDIGNGRIRCVLVKDLSRFGRDYIETGRYLERWLPEHGVRFIAVTDNIDSDRGAYDMMMPLKNLFNTQYARDISQKVKSSLHAKQQRGEFIGAFASYGYCKDPQNHNRLVIDPPAAEVVRRIFTLFENGMGKIRIAKQLNEEGISCPSEYKRLTGEKYRNNHRLETTTYWTYATIHRILQNEMYIGNMEQGRDDRLQMHGKAKRKERSQWTVVSGTHQPIIEKGQWQRVQALLNANARTPDFQQNVSPFAGFLKCGDCGRAMVKTTWGGKIFYTCGSYKRYGASVCSKHYIAHDVVAKVVLDDIREGKVATVITKDQSRLGRNHIETGTYMEIFFPEHGVRYIAINDGYDSNEQSQMDIAPFRNIINEMYAKDTSRKIKSALRTRKKSGKYISSGAPFGYQKDPADHNHLVICLLYTSFSYPKNERLIFLGGRNAAQEEISTMRVG